MLPCAPTIVPPLSLIAATAASSRAPFQSPATTLAPSAAKSVAIASPIPEPAPVITATFPCSRIVSPSYHGHQPAAYLRSGEHTRVITSIEGTDCAAGRVR